MTTPPTTATKTSDASKIIDVVQYNRIGELMGASTRLAVEYFSEPEPDLAALTVVLRRILESSLACTFTLLGKHFYQLVAYRPTLPNGGFEPIDSEKKYLVIGTSFFVSFLGYSDFKASASWILLPLAFIYPAMRDKGLDSSDAAVEEPVVGEGIL